VTVSILLGIIATMANNETPRLFSGAWWCRDRFEERADYLVRRADMLKSAREFFDRSGYVEVETPALQVCPGMEPHLNTFVTSLYDPDGDYRELFLHTSPEFAMKKLLAAGMQRIFQFARVFRNGERSTKNHPEFTMLEWYRVDADWRTIAEMAEELVRAVCGPVARRGNFVCNVAGPWEYLSVAEAVERSTGIDLLQTTQNPLDPDKQALRLAAEEIGVRTIDSDTWEDVFFRIFLERVEPGLGLEAPTVLHSYPASMAALARLSPEDPRVSERFEIFVCGLELANGYSELTDIDEHLARFTATAEQRIAAGRDPIPVDEDFLAAVQSGIPESAGIALGFDRLVMLATGALRIDDVLWAPVVGPTIS
tara:strand:+ start:2781 stop:3884 length:1104 start_codon:yes stop_codon:yes gene_type:complete